MGCKRGQNEVEHASLEKPGYVWRATEPLMHRGAQIGRVADIKADVPSEFDATVPEGLDKLKTLYVMQLVIQGRPLCNCIPKPEESVQRLLEKAQVTLPAVLPHRGVHAATRKKLPPRRKSH